jgi:hypothetical protein
MLDDDDFPSEERNTATIAEELRETLEELGLSPAQLMDRMRSLGDYRKPETILRGINRALAGEIRPGGELIALTQQMLRYQRRLLRTYGDAQWTRLANGSYTAQVPDFRITLVPQTKARWLVVTVHKDGFSSPYPRWQDSLEAAKKMAFVCIDSAQNFLEDYAEQKAREAAGQT